MLSSLSNLRIQPKMPLNNNLIKKIEIGSSIKSNVSIKKDEFKSLTPRAFNFQSKLSCNKPNFSSGQRKVKTFAALTHPTYIIGKKKGFLDSVQLKKILKLSPSSYIGEMPDGLKDCGKETEVLKGLDKLANSVRKGEHKPKLDGENFMNFLCGRASEPESYSSVLGNKVISFNHLGGGEYGNVYKLSVGDKNYALKVFNDSSALYSRGELVPIPKNFGHLSWGETATAIECKNAKVRDVAEFYLANPSDLGNWMLTEYIPEKNYKPRTEGPLAKDFFKKNNVVHTDDSEHNRLNNILFDYGGVKKLGKSL